MKSLKILGWPAGVLAALAVCSLPYGVQAAGPVEQPAVEYRVLEPIASGNLLLFPVVRAGGAPLRETPFLTLDEGIASGEVEVTEAGRLRGLVRPRPIVRWQPGDNGSLRAIPEGPLDRPQRNDQVNTLVLVNHSKKPLLLLAGEIVTGGKQDRVIAKDRIVPAGSEPIYLGVFCIEPGRWTEQTALFGTSNQGAGKSLMVQPSVRERAMVQKDQQQVWDSVHGAIGRVASVGMPAHGAMNQAGNAAPRTFATTSYAQVMQESTVSAEVDKAAAPGIEGGVQVLEKLRAEHAVGVVVAIRGEIVWADLFASTELLAHYWTKLVRSYAAESLTAAPGLGNVTTTDAQQFLNAPASGTEQSEGVVGVYRYLELRSGRTERFVLESLLPGARYEVHISKLRLRQQELRKVHMLPLQREFIFR